MECLPLDGRSGLWSLEGRPHNGHASRTRHHIHRMALFDCEIWREDGSGSLSCTYSLFWR